MSIQGILSYIYWGRSAAFKGGDPSVDEHQAFNALLEFSNPLVHYTQEHVTTPDNLEPNIVYDSKLEIGNTSVKAFFRDPFLLLTMFTYKTMPAGWTETDDTITGALTNLINKDKNIWVQVHAHDHSGKAKHINMLFDGGEITAYKFIIEQGQAIMEEADIQFAEVSANIQPVNIDTGFDDSSFDQTGAVEVSTVICVIKASIVNETYFIIQVISAAYIRTTYNIWFDVTGDGVFTASPGVGTDVKCDISGVGVVTADDVGVIVAAAIGGISADVGATNASGTVTITNVNDGDVSDLVDVDSGLVLAVTTKGIITQNGGWANWDGAYDAALGEVALSTAATITWNTVAIAGLHIQKAVVEFGFPKNPFYTTDSLIATGSILGKVAPHRAIIEGYLDGNQDFTEFLSTYASKTKGTLKIVYGTTKFIQFTNAYIFQIDPPGGLPPAGEAQQASYIILGGANSTISFSWTASEPHDPNDQINHTNV